MSMIFQILLALGLLGSCCARENSSDDCQWARDHECDEPSICLPGTDCTDCNNCPTPNDSCPYAKDGQCDEGLACSIGTDYSDCAGKCAFLYPFVNNGWYNPTSPATYKSGDICGGKAPDANKITISFVCYGISHKIRLGISRDRFGTDKWLELQTLVPRNGELNEWNFAMPPSLINCDPNEYFYFWIANTGLLSSNQHESCRFAPGNILTATDSCDRITYPPASSNQEVQVGASYVSWYLEDSSDWSGYKLEFYLQRQVSYWLDPWWYLVQENAQAERANCIIDEAISTESDSDKWYVKGYYRPWWGLGFISSEFAHGTTFSLADHFNATDTCSYDTEEGVRFRCCKPPFTNNDLCRVSLTDFQLEMKNIELAITVLQPPDDACDSSFAFTLTFVFHIVHDGEVRTYEFPYSYDATLRDILSGGFYVELLNKDELGLAILPNWVGDFDAGVLLSGRCNNNEVTLSLHLQAKVSILSQSLTPSPAKVQIAETSPIQLYVPSAPTGPSAIDAAWERKKKNLDKPPPKGSSSGSETKEVIIGAVAGVLVLCGLAFYCFARHKKNAQKAAPISLGSIETDIDCEAE